MKTRSLLTLSFLISINLFSHQGKLDLFKNVRPNCVGIIKTVTNHRGVNFDGFIAVKLNEETIQLFWETVNEVENDYFVVERSYDGVNFEEVEIVDGIGNTSTNRNDYMVSDQNFKRNNSFVYYRVKQVDLNEKSTYSEIKAVKLSNKNNPARRINLEGQEVNENYEGVVIEIYSNGVNKRFYQTKL